MSYTVFTVQGRQVLSWHPRGKWDRGPTCRRWCTRSRWRGPWGTGTSTAVPGTPRSNTRRCQGTIQGSASIEGERGLCSVFSASLFLVSDRSACILHFDCSFCEILKRNRGWNNIIEQVTDSLSPCSSFPGSCSMQRGMSVHVPSSWKFKFTHRLRLSLKWDSLITKDFSF